MSTLPIIEPLAFDCSRTCPLFERVDLCRFGALLSSIGCRAVVNSHTVSVAVSFTDRQALRAAVESLGGVWIGNGSHKLFQRGTVDGLAFSLPKWRYPLVATAAGTLDYDNYGGRWGNVADVEALTAAYAQEAAALACSRLGWQFEREPGGGLLVFHPSGGTLAVNAAGTVDANGFNGSGCHAAAGTLADAIGTAQEFTAKPEFYAQEQTAELE